MALQLTSLNLLTKSSLTKAILNIRYCCKVSEVACKFLPQTSAKQRTLPLKNFNFRNYFISVHRNLQSTEQYGKKTGKTPRYSYDINIEVPENVLLYTDGNRRHFFGLVQVFSIGAFMIFTLIGDTMRQVIKQLRNVPVAEGEPVKWYQWWKRLQPGSIMAGNVLFFLLSAGGLLLCIFGHVYPSRMICSVWLLRGGRSVSLSTYKSWGRIKTTKYLLKEISCESDPASVQRYIPFKIKRKALYFLVDKKKGKFYNDRIFHGAFALKREL